MLTVWMTLLPSIFLSGFFFPLEAMPPFLRWLSYLMPLRYYLVIIRSLLLKGVGLDMIQNDVIAMIIFAVGIMTAAALRFRKTTRLIQKFKGDYSMNHKRPPLPAIIIIALLIFVSAYFIITQALCRKEWSVDRFRHYRSCASERCTRNGWQSDRSPCRRRSTCSDECPASSSGPEPADCPTSRCLRPVGFCQSRPRIPRRPNMINRNCNRRASHQRAKRLAHFCVPANLTNRYGTSNRLIRLPLPKSN